MTRPTPPDRIQGCMSGAPRPLHDVREGVHSDRALSRWSIARMTACGRRAHAGGTRRADRQQQESLQKRARNEGSTRQGDGHELAK